MMQFCMQTIQLTRQNYQLQSVVFIVAQKLILLRSGRVEILISDQVQKLEGNCQQADPEQVTHRG